MQPDVSVVIAAKNEEKHVAEAVSSILSQEGLRIELVFVDDGSTDRTHEIVAGFVSGNQNLLLVNNPSRGKVSAFNYGVSLATGEWICIFAGDDVMPPGSLLGRWLAVKDSVSDKPVVGLSRLVQMSEIKKQDGVVVPKDPNRGGLTGTSYLMDRRAVAKLFPVPEELPNEDTWLETGVLHFDFTLVHSGVIGNQWRVHAGNSINTLLGFDEFNRRLTPRMGAYALFLARHGQELTEDSRKHLEAKVECEAGRRDGNLLRIAFSGATRVERLRASSLSNRHLYAVRRGLYRLFSGW